VPQLKYSWKYRSNWNENVADEREHNDQGVCFTWIDFKVWRDAVCVHDGLEHASKLVGLVVGRRRLLRLHTVQYWRHAAAAALLDKQGVQGHTIRNSDGGSSIVGLMVIWSQSLNNHRMWCKWVSEQSEWVNAGGLWIAACSTVVVQHWVSITTKQAKASLPNQCRNRSAARSEREQRGWRHDLWSWCE